MRIVIVAGYAPSLVNFRGPLLRALVARGHKVMALAPPEEPGSPDTSISLRAMGVELIRFPMRRGGVDPRQDLRTLLALRREFQLLQPDLILAYTIKPVIYGSLAARWAFRGTGNTPVVASLITGLGYAFGGLEMEADSAGDNPAGDAKSCSFAQKWSGRRLLSELVVRLYRKALEHNRVVIFQNPDDRDLFASLGITGQGQRVAVVAGSGVDLEHFAPAAPVLAHPHTGAPIFLCVARLLWSKGVGVFVEACRLLKQRHPHAICRLVGPLDPGPDGVPAEMVRCWREERVVEVLDPVQDVRPHLAEASVFVLPTFYREGTPRSILEALSMARPVITTDMPGCRQTVEEGVTGYLVPPFEPGALMRAMARFVEQPELIAPMGAAGRRLAEEKFDADIVVRDMLLAMGLAEPPGAQAHGPTGLDDAQVNVEDNLEDNAEGVAPGQEPGAGR
ncbi:MAG: glycosyltransferase family 4 protein [Humidesulfovibrio sp.]|uniref:glycosyltransferase family 4 protein n=1 Tax=Humidesulfovibrio sp. TaxID=2910988 RepID=UPI0027F49EC4|nr:glycosyltransferase family 4 protein [Humidesulfovibrio sp.]MDQ7836333.1 glycosyltransferase family 4 protein [Humidesulfovibrio sp.]